MLATRQQSRPGRSIVPSADLYLPGTHGSQKVCAALGVKPASDPTNANEISFRDPECSLRSRSDAKRAAQHVQRRSGERGNDGLPARQHEAFEKSQVAARRNPAKLKSSTYSARTQPKLIDALRSLCGHGNSGRASRAFRAQTPFPVNLFL